MSDDSTNNFPKLHNAAWPGLVGKGPDADEPAIDLQTMLDMTADAEVDGLRRQTLWHKDGLRSTHDDSGAGVHLADLVHTVIGCPRHS